MAEGLTVYKAAKRTGMPKETLRRHLQHSQCDKRNGPGAILCKRDEDQLGAYAKFVASSGHPKTPKWMCETATGLLQEGYASIETLFSHTKPQLKFDV